MTTSVSELWRAHLSQAFGRLAPTDAGEATGAMSGAALGPLVACRISGGPQLLRRTAPAVRRELGALSPPNSVVRLDVTSVAKQGCQRAPGISLP